MSECRPFQEAVAADPAPSYRIRDFLATGNPALADLPDPAALAAPQSPSGPGPATADGTSPAGPGTGAGPAASPAPGAPLEGTPPVTPPAGGGPVEAPGAETQSATANVIGGPLPPERCGLLLTSGGTCKRLAGHEGDCAPATDVVTPEEVEAEFGPARTESEPGQ